MSGIFAFGSYKKNNSLELMITAMVKSLALLCKHKYTSSKICVLKNGDELFYEQVTAASKGLLGRFLRRNTEITSQPIIGLGHVHYAACKQGYNANPYLFNVGDFYVAQNNNYYYSKVAAEYSDRLYKDNNNLTLYEIAFQVQERFLFDNTGFVFVSRKHPNELAAFSKSFPLRITRNIESSQYFIESNTSIFNSSEMEFYDLENHMIAHISQDGLKIYNESNGKLIENRDIVWLKHSKNKVKLKLDKYKHYMEKETMEQGQIIKNMIKKRIDFETQSVKLSGLGTDGINKIIESKRILIIGTGTSYHASMAVQSAVQFFTGKECKAILCSVFYSENIQVSNQDAVILVSQYLEAAEMLDVQRECKKNGAFLVAVTNRDFGVIFTESNCGIRIRAGPEVAVVSTKIFSCQCVTLLLIALRVSQEQKTFEKERKRLIETIKELPSAINKVLSLNLRKAGHIVQETKVLFIVGGWEDLAVCKEGECKIREVNRKMATAVQCTDLKREKIFSLVERNLGFIMIASEVTNGESTSKLTPYNAFIKLLIHGGKLFVICNERNENEYKSKADCIVVPFTHEYLQPILNAIPIQIISCFVQ